MYILYTKIHSNYYMHYAQTNDLAAVHLGVKFSCNFTLKEVEERWYALLYQQQISK